MPPEEAASHALPMRPTVLGTRHMVSAGHWLAAEAAFQILEAGGNAIDAGVAAGLALGVVQSDLVNVAGVAPIILRTAAGEVATIAGLGHWPKALPADLFLRQHAGKIPQGVLRTVVPAAPDAWITALERWGTRSFAEVAAAAMRFAEEGFLMYPLMAELVGQMAERYARWPSSAAIYLPGGRPPAVGELFRQQDLAASLRCMVEAERAAAAGGRVAGLHAARDAFYRGDLAQAILRCQRSEGGYLSASDLAEFRSGIEPPVAVRFRDWTVYTCGAWCQGPVLAQMLRLLADLDATIGHNSLAYVHRVTEAMKLSFADRHAHYGDPRFVSVPLARLLADDYAAERRTLIRADRACPGMPSAGLASKPGGRLAHAAGAAAMALDTSYVAVVDRWGNAFSATPSDTSFDTPVVPGTGLAISSRGSQSWADPALPAGVAPGKRPRLTPSPALAVRDDGALLPFGTPGGDVQAQAMLQCFLNLTLFGIEPQAAVEAPRFASYSFPDSFEPHAMLPGRLALEAPLARSCGAALGKLGHDVEAWPERTRKAGAVCLVLAEPGKRRLQGAADPRRTCYALGW
ncbi:MAG: gamma-glutamyltransferase family protein [Alphaproteobacteria bacterium]|nr:gamma-glutamyltransferase family protein [Alphaproteobacteria bacterium]